MKNKELERVLERSGLIYSEGVDECVKSNNHTTTVIIRIDNNYSFRQKFVGVAKCSDEDVFDKKIGYQIARARAENQLLGMVKSHIHKEREKLDTVENAINEVQKANKLTMNSIYGREFKIGDKVEIISNSSIGNPHYLLIGGYGTVIYVYGDGCLEVDGMSCYWNDNVPQTVHPNDLKLIGGLK